MSTSFKSQLGAQAERHVAQWLQQEQYAILAFNYRQRCGEIDIVAHHQADQVIAFIEVKMRTTDYFNLSEVVNSVKQRKIIATAKWFCAEFPQVTREKVLRFDVALVHTQQDGLSLEYIPNAFTQEYRF
jgi:putative endonuclease